MPCPQTGRRSVRLVVERLDERAVPANDLTVVEPAASTANVATSMDVPSGTFTFSATGPSATLRITDIRDVMRLPGITRVVLTTADPDAPDGGQEGDIRWSATTGDLDFAGFGTGRSLILRAADDIELVGVRFFANGDAANNARLEFDTSAGGGDVRFLAGATDSVVFDEGAVSALIVSTGGGAFTYQDAPAGFSYARALGPISISAGAVTLSNQGGFDAGADLSMTAAAIQLGAGLGAGGVITLTAPVTLTRDVAVGRLPGHPGGPTAAVTLAGPVDGPFALYSNADTVTIQQAVGAQTALTALNLASGDVQYGANAIQAAAIVVGDGFLPLVSLSGTGPLTGAVFVRRDGTLRPGGAGAVGVLPVTGELTLAGVLGLDIGPASDQVLVVGNVTLTGQPWLDLQGYLPGLGDTRVIDFSGALTGTFVNAPVSNVYPILTGADILTVSNYGPATTGITVAPFAVPFNGVRGAEFDGTGYLVRLTGPGVLGAIRDSSGTLVLATHETTPASRLLVTTAANGSDDVVRIASAFVHGSLGALSAPKADAIVRADGALGSVVLRTADGLTADRLGSLRAQSIPGDVRVIRAVGTVSAAEFAGDLTAGSVGSVTVGGLIGVGPTAPRATWAVAGHIGSVTVRELARLDLTARSLGTLTVAGRPGTFAGDMTDATVTLTGNAGAGRVALRAVRVAGVVAGSLFDIKDGNVSSFTVGRFVNSRLFLGYAPDGAFNAGGTFDPNRSGTLVRFATTSRPLGDPTNPANFAFAGSQVAADTFGAVRLSGLATANGGTAFGFKFHTAHGSVRAAAAGPGTLPLDTDLNPATGQADDFFLVAG